MGFLKALLVCQVILVLGMAPSTDALFLVNNVIRPVVSTIFGIIKAILCIPLKIVRYIACCLIKLAIGGLKALLVIGDEISRSQRARRSLPEMPMAAAEPSALSKVNLLGPGGLLTAASKYAA